MTIGDKIKHIRTFRGMKQQDLGIALGLSEKIADNRIAQYETNYRVPPKDMLLQIAEVLNVSPLNFVIDNAGGLDDIMMTLFWLDENKRGFIGLFQ